MKYTYHRVCHARSFKFDKCSSERQGKKKIINLHHAQFFEQRFLVVDKPCYVKGLQSWEPYKHLDESSVAHSVACVEASVSGTLLFLLFSKDRNQIAHE